MRNRRHGATTIDGVDQSDLNDDSNTNLYATYNTLSGMTSIARSLPPVLPLPLASAAAAVSSPALPKLPTSSNVNGTVNSNGSSSVVRSPNATSSTPTDTNQSQSASNTHVGDDNHDNDIALSSLPSPPHVFNSHNGHFGSSTLPAAIAAWH
jgi:hypothetical protein